MVGQTEGLPIGSVSLDTLIYGDGQCAYILHVILISHFSKTFWRYSHFCACQSRRLFERVEYFFIIS